MGKKNTTKIGNIGENLVAEYLSANKHSIIVRNYKPKVAELDIISVREGTVHFVEVKSVSYETMAELEDNVARGTYRPEELVNSKKLRKISQGVQIWLLETGFTGNYQIDVAVVHMVPHETYAKITLIEDVNRE